MVRQGTPENVELEEKTLKTERVFNKDYVRILIAALLALTGNQVIMIIMPLYMDKLGIDAAVLGVATSASAFASMLARPASGMLADKKSKKFVMILGLSIMIMGLLGFTIAPFAVAIVIIRIAQGVGFSAETTAQMAIAVDVLPKSKVNKGLSYFGICNTMSGLFGSIIGMALVSGDNFNPAWLGGAGMFAVSLIIVSTLKYERPHIKSGNCLQEDSEEPVEPEESAALPQSQLHSQNIEENIVSTSTNGNGSRANWLWTFFERKAFLPSLVQVVIITASSGIVFLPSYSVQIGTNIPIFYTLQALSMLLTNIAVGNLIDRIGNPVSLFVPSAFCFSISLILISLATGNTMFCVAALLYGFGLGACVSSMSVVVMSMATPNRRGAASATFQCAGDIGFSIGSLAGGVIVGILGYRAFFASLAVLPIIAIVMSIFILGRK